ncbi:MAG: flagellar biosynthesis anti-sigma factor FlgM [Deltaproteobacteria bacterium]|nr:MAG: flagellar biosynthesis anti-sigma factor FlgM [Deltaproteobacteria bacterium]
MVDNSGEWFFRRLERGVDMSVSSVSSVLYSDALKALDTSRKADAAKKGEVEVGVDRSQEQGDKVTISSRGNDLGRLAELTKAAPEIRSERVAELKSALEDGSLKVDSRELAAKMFKEMSLESWF